MPRPLLPFLLPGQASGQVAGSSVIRVAWPLANGGELLLFANLADNPAQLEPSVPLPPVFETLYAWPHLPENQALECAPWSLWLRLSKGPIQP